MFDINEGEENEDEEEEEELINVFRGLNTYVVHPWLAALVAWLVDGNFADLDTIFQKLDDIMKQWININPFQSYLYGVANTTAWDFILQRQKNALETLKIEIYYCLLVDLAASQLDTTNPPLLRQVNDTRTKVKTQLLVGDVKNSNSNQQKMKHAFSPLTSWLCTVCYFVVSLILNCSC